MQVHEKVEDLMYNFIKFLDHNSLYLRMIIEKERWEVIIIKCECINAERRDVIKAKKIVISRWDQKLLNLWTSKENFSLYSIKRKIMIKMHAAITRVKNEHLTRAIMKQIVYH